MKYLPKSSFRVLQTSAVLATILFLSLGAQALAFEDSKGRFVIDLPKGWKLDPQTDEKVYVFKGDDMSIIIEYHPSLGDPGALFTQGLNSLKAAGLPNASPAEETRDMTVNGNKARQGLYQDEVAYGSLKVKLYGLIGGVALTQGGISFLSILNDSSLKKMRSRLEASLQSVRTAGQAKTGAREVTTASAAPAAAAAPAGGPTSFEHRYLTLSVPAGWRTEPLQPNFEKEIIAWLKSDTIPGASIMVSCYRGMGLNHRKVRIGGLKTIASVYPQGQKQLKKETKVRTEQGKKAVVEVWQGLSGSTLMQSPLGIMKTRDCWVMMIGYVADSFGPQLEGDFMKVLHFAE